MDSYKSPNFNERASGARLEYIVLHYTDMENAQAALSRLCDASAGVSAHYVVDKGGEIYQLVDEKARAWHAGESFWRGIMDMNSASIGIELVNRGHSFGYEPFPEKQIGALEKLMLDIIKRNSLSAKFSPLAHSDIAPSRKKDPGELFPWKKLADDGIGLWPCLSADDYGDMSVSEAGELLRNIGYDCRSGEIDALSAFQRRYNPTAVFGNLDNKTAATLRSRSRAATGVSWR
ncbi:MAG: N-acetylmuramoyl-L-alanine amidase [Alphaproteobacteria bacterium]|nr:N-acetylmuramoyl-L-alanine amidase [Alphaproteobacteria bacterium]